MGSIPKFDELPVQKGAPAESSWGVFGEDDGIGCLNFLTPAGIVEAAQLVQSGKVFRLDAKLGFAKPTLFGRATLGKTSRQKAEDRRFAKAIVQT